MELSDLNIPCKNEFSNILLNVENYISLTEEERGFFVSLIEIQSVKRKECIIEKGDISAYSYYINNGCLRSYEIDQRGNLHIIMFAMEDDWICDLQSFIARTPSAGYVEAIEDSEVMRISHANYTRLLRKIPQFEKFFRIMYQNNFLVLKERLIENLSFTAEERYLNFLKTYPDLVNRVPQKQIASFLGFTPEFLSMIRNRLARRR